jgi:hypothetical protein
MKIKKRGLEFGFAWIFAILVGAFIIFISIYITTQLIEVESQTGDSFLAKEFGVLLNPLETNLDSSRAAKIIFPKNTQIFNDCSFSGSFGTQTIRALSEKGFNTELELTGRPIVFRNKYIFSEERVVGKEIPIFSMSFDFPYKVADLIYLLGDEDEYCFVDPPGDVEDDILELSVDNVVIVDRINECSPEYEKVCFDSTHGDCDIKVFTGTKRVEKDGSTVYYSDEFDNSLIFGAIFANPRIYECQVKRLMKRASLISSIYLSKTEYLSAKGCRSNLESDLASYKGSAELFLESKNLINVEIFAKELTRKNEKLVCKLF